MAEGGRKDDDENPFSFQNYVKKKSNPDTKNHQNESSASDEVDIFDLPDIPSPKRERSHLKIVDDVEKKSKKPQKKDENPFSFKKFIAANSNPGHSGSKFYVNGVAGIAPDVASDLPDFVQDHINNHDGRPRTVSSRSARSRTQSDISLPDFALDSGAVEPSSPDNRTSFPSIDAIGNALVRSDSRFNNRNLSNGDGDDTVAVSMSPGVLPDFLTDSSVLSNMNNNDGANQSNSSTANRLHSSRPNSSRVSPNNNLALEVKRLQEENEHLRREMEDNQRLAQKESQRVAELLRDREKSQTKEAEETAAMATMIQQVEANLITSTQRAVKAENTVTKLKQEMKSLQNELTCLNAENEILRAGHPASADVHDQTKYVSQQLLAAANTAEQTLKQLIGGVDNLKLMSDILSSLGKISSASSPEDDKQTADEDGDKSHATEKDDKQTG
ncbi:uncharacterized protein LOC141902021 [Tubulanus polymorphus]|uniref:uncharacterized protein LOC141902021 n=1 Tax=Tubulanus polymorphus TaxID=672921 RepID=UPI003DA43201